ncbi:aminoglycoside phosphotransferase family protein [Streptomyces drozdowiczii]|uniref:Aminoglycoside phosphotransferase family protein n=1 Tax=Streptomyces drozdowiczii TaxID=202862 RepID=A0ABY6PSB6_9ACTN|nr:aminoglycoside phosphotransferase family protein [Streptomyces drozdowiczii]UZK55162.1 aminoglycoside phosphotransferase family protein [Streptomyces drozdowiczii]
MIDIPDALIATQSAYNGEAGRAFVAALPGLAAEFLERWGLRRDGEAMYGVCALVLPVVRAGDGRRAVLKLQPVDAETAGEPVALRLWGAAGAGAVRLLAHDPATGSMLLERLDGRRSLEGEPDADRAVRVIAGLLAGLTAVRPGSGARMGMDAAGAGGGAGAGAGAGLRGLGEAVARMLAAAPDVVAALVDEEERGLVRDCAAAVREVAGEPGDRLLHWDLHFGNVLAGEGGAWVAIDPKPLVGDPGFELLPALVNRFEAGAVGKRFDAMTGVLELDRARAAAWTLGRVLQNACWSVESGARRLAPEQAEIARVVRGSVRSMGRG